MPEEYEVLNTTLQRVLITQKFQRTDEALNPGQASIWLLFTSLSEPQSGTFLGVQVNYFDNMIISSTPRLL